MKSRKRSLIAMLVVATLAAVVTPTSPVGAAPAAVKYVDPAGSDAAQGTANQPWRTLQHAVGSVGPGDTIVVNPGVYAGMRIETSGTDDAWIRITAAQPGTATIDRPGAANRHDSNIEIETWDGDGTVAYWIVEGLEVTNAPNWGIDTRGNALNHSHHITIRENHVHHNGLGSTKTGIFFAFTDHVRVTGNDSHHNGEHGVYLSNSGDNFTVRRNQLHDNERCGLHMNGDLSQGGDGLISDGSVDANWIEGNGAEGCAGVNMDGVTDTTITNNVIVENHATGIAIFRQDGAQCSRRNEIVNNTIVQAADGRWAIVVGGAGCRDNSIVNNVLLTRHAFRGAIEMPTASVPGLVSDYNIVADRFTVDDGASVIDLDAWRRATGQDAHSQIAAIDEVFIAGRYRHLPGGVAEDAGAPSPPVGLGFDGVSRTAGDAPDIGAYETPYCNGARATHIGTRNADTIVGGPDADVLVGLGGRDTLKGKGDADVICGGSGGDTIRGGAGRDVIRANRGPDDIDGGKAGDTVYGNSGADTIDGGTGADFLRGGKGVDTVDGGPGTDDCTGETQVGCEL